MKSTTSRALACLFVAALAVPATAQSAVRFADVAGWWSADPVQRGESSHVALQFVEKDGKQEARLWLMAIGAYDVNLGAVKIAGDTVDTSRCRFR